MFRNIVKLMSLILTIILHETNPPPPPKMFIKIGCTCRKHVRDMARLGFRTYERLLSRRPELRMT